MDKRCSHCSGGQLQDGFVEDSGEAARGFARWIPGQLERGILGRAKRFGKERLTITGTRCADCSHIDLFAN